MADKKICSSCKIKPVYNGPTRAINPTLCRDCWISLNTEKCPTCKNIKYKNKDCENCSKKIY